MVSAAAVVVLSLRALCIPPATFATISIDSPSFAHAVDSSASSPHIRIASDGRADVNPPFHFPLVATMAASAARTTITRSSLAALQSSYVRAASSFQTYNFREYFLRVADRTFSSDLERIVGSSTLQTLSLPAISLTSKDAASASSSQKSTSSEGAADDKDLLSQLSDDKKKELVDWYNQSEADLEQWKRSSIVNNLFLAPRLVVEGAGTVMSPGGGGAGMEAR